MKRPMTLVAGILAVVVDTIYAIIMLIGISAIIQIFGGASGSMMYAIISLMELALVVDAIIMNAISISGFACNHESYKRKYRYIIYAIVLNFILAGFMIYSMVIAFGILDLFVLLGSVAASVLYIVDMAIEKNRQAKAAANTTEEKAN